MQNAVEFTHVWKKFKKGEKFTSLRDSIPHSVRKLFHKEDEMQLADKEFWATKDVTFSVAPGDVVGIIGPNGAGKSTILKLLSGIMVPTKGDLKINGRLSALIEVTAGFHPELTGRENIYLNGTILGMKRKEIDKRFDDIVEFSGISEFIDTPVKRYSSGMYSRLGFSVAAHVNPDVLLVDEVLAVGDISFQSRCAEKMRELLKSGVTIVLVSHNLQLVQSLCKRVILLNKGEVIQEGSAEDVIPYYENLVFKQQEEKLKKKMGLSDSYKVSVQDKEGKDVQITSVNISDRNVGSNGTLTSSSDITFDIEYDARKRVESPIFSVQIERGDGVLCCASSTKESGFDIGTIDGQGSISVNMGKLGLTPGIYMVKVGIWDKELIHPYVIRKKDVLRIGADEANKNRKGVFLPSVEWKAGKIKHDKAKK